MLRKDTNKLTAVAACLAASGVGRKTLVYWTESATAVLEHSVGPAIGSETVTSRLSSRRTMVDRGTMRCNTTTDLPSGVVKK